MGDISDACLARELRNSLAINRAAKDGHASSLLGHMLSENRAVGSLRQCLDHLVVEHFPYGSLHHVEALPVCAAICGYADDDGLVQFPFVVSAVVLSVQVSCL